MKNKTFVLFKAQFTARFALGGRDGKRAKPIVTAVAVVAIAALAAVYVGLYCLAVDALTRAAVAMEYPDIAYDLVIAAVMAICFLFGIPVVLSNLFLVRDGELLSSLPVTPGQIFSSKFLLVYLGELVLTAIFVLPATVIYAVRVPEVASLWFFLRALYVTLLLPAIPLLGAAIVVIPVMLIASKVRRRELFITVGSLLLVGAMFILQLRLQSMLDASVENADLFGNLLKNNFSRLSAIAIPPMSWASNGVYGGGLTSVMSLACFTLAVIVCFFAARGIMSLIYRNSLRSLLENRRAARRIPSAQAAAEPTSPLSAIIRREWQTLLRSPSWVLNGLTGGLIALLFMILPLFENETRLAFVSLVSALDPSLLAVVLAGAIGLLSCVNAAASSVVSRQGAGFRILKSLPISYEKICLGYLIFGSEVCLTWAIPLLVGSVAVLGLPILPALGGTVLGLVVSTGMTAAMSIVDMLRPKLDWTNEAEPIKQNIGGLAGMILSIALLAVIGLAVYFVMAHTTLPLFAGYAVGMVLGLASIGILWPLTIKKAAKRLESIDC